MDVPGNGVACQERRCKRGHGILFGEEEAAVEVVN